MHVWYSLPESIKIDDLNMFFHYILGLGIVSLPSIYTKVASYASSGLIDPVSNLKDDKVYIYHGLLDVVVSASNYNFI